MSEEATDAGKIDMRKVSKSQMCPTCNKLITGIPMVIGRHIKNCKPTEAEAVTATAEKVKRIVPVGEIKDDSVRKLMEMAAATQEAMRESPNAFVGDLASDENMALRKTYAPETIERFDKVGRPLHTHTAYLEDANRIQQAIARGYVPVISEQGQFVRNSGGDILCTLERKIYDAKISKVQNESRARVGRVTADTKARNPDLRDSDITEESFGAVGTLTLTEDDRVVNKET